MRMQQGNGDARQRDDQEQYALQSITVSARTSFSWSTHAARFKAANEKSSKDSRLLERS